MSMTMRDAAGSFCERIASITDEYNSNIGRKSENEKLSLQMLHLGCDKMMSIITLLDYGIQMRIKGGILSKPSLISPYSIARSLYELMLIHHSLFVNTKTMEEMKVLVNLWKIKSYNQRIKLYDGNKKQFEKQKANDIDSFRTLVALIVNTSIYVECKKQLDNAFETDKLGYFEFKRNNGKLSLVATSFGDRDLFSRIYNDMEGLSEINNDMVYKYLSMNSHPSYLSVLQFHQQNNIPKKELPLECAIFFIYRMIKSHEYLQKRL